MIGHDAFCEGSLCACEVRGEIPYDVHEWLAETYKPAGVAIWMRDYVFGTDARREMLIRLARTPVMGS